MLFPFPRRIGQRSVILTSCIDDMQTSAGNSADGAIHHGRGKNNSRSREGPRAREKRDDRSPANRASSRVSHETRRGTCARPRPEIGGPDLNVRPGRLPEPAPTLNRAQVRAAQQLMPRGQSPGRFPTRSSAGTQRCAASCGEAGKKYLPSAPAASPPRRLPFFITEDFVRLPGGSAGRDR